MRAGSTSSGRAGACLSRKRRRELTVQETRIGLRLASLRQPFRKALHTAAQVGVRGVEVDARNELRPGEMTRTATRQLLKLLDDLNLKVCGVAFPTRRGYADPEQLDRRIQATQAAMQLAYDLRAREVILSVGPIPTEGDPALDLLIDALSGLAAYSDRAGARLALLTDWDNAVELSRVLRLLPEDAVGVAIHPGTLIRRKLSPSQLVEQFGRHVSYVYASDAVGGLAGGQVQEMDLGRGSADIPALLAVLEGLDYQGWVTIDRRETALSAEQAENAVKFLRSL